MSDVVESQKIGIQRDRAGQPAQLYDNVTHKRSYYGVPLKEQALHDRGVEAAGRGGRLQDGGHPEGRGTQYFDFFEDVQKKLRAKGKRVYGLGYSLATKDSDSTYLFNQFLVAYGGGGIVTPDGKLHVDDPKVAQGGDQTR